MLALNNNNTTNIYYFQRQLLVEAWDRDDAPSTFDDVIDHITIPMMQTGNEFELSNTHTISGENGIGIFTLIYYNITTEPTTHTSMHTTTNSTAILNRNPTFTVSSFSFCHY